MSGSRESPWTFESERRRSSALGGGSVDGLPGAVSSEYDDTALLSGTDFVPVRGGFLICCT